MPEKINQFNQRNLKQLRPIIVDTLLQMGRDFGFTPDVGSASFNDREVTFKLKLTLTDERGNPVDMQAENFKQFAMLYGLQAEHLGQSFLVQGKRYVIKGLCDGSRKYPILAIQIATGREYKFPAETVRRALGITERQRPLRVEPLSNPPEVTIIRPGDVGNLSDVLGLGNRSTSKGRRPYLSFVEDLINQAAYTQQGIIEHVLRDYPGTSESSLKTFLTDLRNPKYSAFKPRYVQVSDRGLLSFVRH